MKNRIVIDLKVFNLILRELRLIKKDLRSKGDTASARPAPPRDLKDKVYSNDVLRILKITPATLIKYEKMGLLRYHKEGRSKVYSENEVREFKKAKGRRKRIGKSFLKKVKS
ncbi:MAG TPA: hypothetical protein VI731_04315 [Bacteroidia bacterium]|nr:hypothetical protein [Bacteroidia bacterium]